ncbi:SGNH/GDSL hydrolase family protein [Rossellomorea aquimaris]|uniref:SGNH/GDSL hydrolase family protein n=1 Tax=Rossellomorea aquimaris TaxID=189382 RepID=A0A5D4TLH8_9BACI|nr:SGNH/GDSL hydrolase family protein [Rossellomorea aquimaris]TYS76537.1 SGNH/GDSL hydrolase family protein [Rossellomorea aquimaris]TYS83127.1 SGNH/GDSL hydrolase family protein [Rossellomorea aquimaris]
MKWRLGILIILLMIFILMLRISWNGSWDIFNKYKNQEDWVGVWTASMQAPFEDGISQKGFENQTIRMVLHPHVDGNKIRLRLSNIFSEEPLAIEEVHVAISQKGSEIDPDTDQQVTFNGESTLSIPPGERKFSDSISLELSGDKALAVSLYVKEKSGPVTWHPISMQTTYISNGNDVSKSVSSAFNEQENSWFWLDGVDTLADSSVKGIVVMGSSIANGNSSTVNKNRRWPNYLARRLKQKDSDLTIMNAGISGNQLINSLPDKGENAYTRLERDVFNQSGVKAVILHQGLNDIRHYPEYDADKIIERMKQIIDSTHDQGLTIYGGTLTPFKGSGMFTSKGENTRQEVNDWIRTSGEFDGVIDFDKALRDPDEPERYLQKYDSGDHLHPNDAGYKRMADTVDPSLFK